MSLLFQLGGKILDVLLAFSLRSIEFNICSTLDLKEEKVKRILNSIERKLQASKTSRIFPPSWNNKDIL